MYLANPLEFHSLFFPDLEIGDEPTHRVVMQDGGEASGHGSKRLWVKGRGGSRNDGAMEMGGVGGGGGLEPRT